MVGVFFSVKQVCNLGRYNTKTGIKKSSSPKGTDRGGKDANGPISAGKALFFFSPLFSVGGSRSEWKNGGKDIE